MQNIEFEYGYWNLEDVRVINVIEININWFKIIIVNNWLLLNSILVSLSIVNIPLFKFKFWYF